MPLSLDQLEERIRRSRGANSFYDEGTALQVIRAGKLYKSAYSTFETYCQDRWDLARRTTYQLIEAAQVVDNVRSCAQIIPLNEYQARPLTRLAPDEQRLAWVYIIRNAPNGIITSKFVNQAVTKLYPKSLRSSNKIRKKRLDALLKKIVNDMTSLNQLFNGYGSQKNLLSEIRMRSKEFQNLTHGIHFSNFEDGIRISSNQNIPELNIDFSIYKNIKQQGGSNHSNKSGPKFKSKPSVSNDPYQILGVDMNASKDEIKSARNRLIKMYHPDQFEVLKLREDHKWIFAEAEERMKKVNWAFGELESR